AAGPGDAGGSGGAGSASIRPRTPDRPPPRSGRPGRVPDGPARWGDHRLRGYSSFYGRDFHGKKTANGEVFNMYKLSAAHRTLPLGTRARVWNVKNGLSVQVVINDRGPFIEGRILDLSFAAALELEMVDEGVAMVQVEILELPKDPPARPF
ncbi:MAG: septal ring lytic transglycosylase RlpA family protein, partial [bacterium]